MPPKKPSLFPTLSLTFDLELRHSDIEHFRGAFSATVAAQEDVFHNHDNEHGDGSPKGDAYPLIQYGVHGGNASIFAIGKGAEALARLDRSKAFTHFAIQDRPMSLTVTERDRNSSFIPGLLPKGEMHRYRIYRYLAMGPDKYTQYKQTDALRDKLSILEARICAHITDFGHAVDWHPEREKLVAVINDIDRVKKATWRKRSFMAFDLVFSTNAQLPDRIGLGNHKAFGFGWLYRLP